MGIAVLLSRLLGLLREKIFAHLFGAGFFSDAFIVAYRIPNLFRDLFAEGALSTAFVSVFSKEKLKEEKHELALRMGALLSFVLLLLCSLLALLAPQIVEFFASHFKSDPLKFDLTVQLTRPLSFFLYFASMAALSMGILNSLGYYFLPALGSAAFNVVNIVLGGGAAYWAIHSQKNMTLAIGLFAGAYLLGGFAQWFVQWKLLRKESFQPSLGFFKIFSWSYLKKACFDTRIKRVFKIMLPSILTVGAMQVNVLVNTIFATGLDEGSVSWLSYAFRLVHFPMGVFGVSIFMAALPQLSRQTKDKREFEKILHESLNLSLILAVASSMGLFLMGENIVSLIFEGGKFTRQDAHSTALALSAYAVGLLAFNWSKICTSVFFALEKIWIPSLLAVLGVISNFIFSYFLSQKYQHAGIALSVSLTASLFVFFMFLFIRRMGYCVFNKKLFQNLILSFSGGALMWGATTYFQMKDQLFLLRDQQGVFIYAIGVFAVIALLGIVFFLPLLAFSEDARILVKKILRK